MLMQLLIKKATTSLVTVRVMSPPSVNGVILPALLCSFSAVGCCRLLRRQERKKRESKK